MTDLKLCVVCWAGKINFTAGVMKQRYLRRYSKKLCYIFQINLTDFYSLLSILALKNQPIGYSSLAVYSPNFEKGRMGYLGVMIAKIKWHPGACFIDRKLLNQHPCLNFNSGLINPYLKLGHAWVVTFPIKLYMELLIHTLIPVYLCE